MAIQPTPIAADRYEDFVWHHLKDFEGAVPRIYSDQRGVPTMGAGVALAIRSAAGWVLLPRERLGAEISGDAAAPYRFTADEWTLLERVAALLRAGASEAECHRLIPPFVAARETAACNRFGFSLTESRIRAQALARWPAARRAVLTDLEAEARRQGKPADLTQQFALSRQEVGMTSVRYNIGSGLRTPRATAALAAGDRAALAFEIAYATNPESNGPARPGIARRRLAEARLAAGEPAEWNADERHRFAELAGTPRVAAYLAATGSAGLMV
jgi:GH24 family phage-related lysozyme (muramidase)